MEISEIKNGNMNKVYLLNIKKNKYIIRTSDFDNSFECKVLNLLEKEDFNSPKIITSFKLENKNIMIYRYLEGSNPQEFNDWFFVNIAKILNQLHSIDYQELYQYSLQNEENLMKLSEYYNKAIESNYLTGEKDLIDELYQRVLKMDFISLDKCIIHSDIKKENMIQNNQELYLIDFGNCYIGTRLVDIIRVIMWFFIKNNNYDYDQITLFVNEYFKYNPIKDIEVSLVNDLLTLAKKGDKLEITGFDIIC